MNLFFLHFNPVIAAQTQCDKHVVKMTLETAQILSTVCTKYSLIDDLFYKSTHSNHPVVLWTGESYSNFLWVVQHGLALSREYTRRYKKIHKSESVIRRVAMMMHLINFPSVEFTYPKLCMPDNCKIEDGNVVKSYRNFYIIEKRKFAKWKLGNTPYWMN